VLARRVLLGVKIDELTALRGLAGRRRLRGNVWWLDKEGETGAESKSVVARGVRSSSEFSEMVWSISSWLPKLEKDSSEGFRIGLRWRPGVLKGEVERGVVVWLLLLSGMGEECARAMCGAKRGLPEERDRAWPRAKGERGRGR